MAEQHHYKIRCQRCGRLNPLDAAFCEAPGCGADLNLYGKPIDLDAVERSSDSEPTVQHVFHDDSHVRKTGSNTGRFKRQKKTQSDRQKKPWHVRRARKPAPDRRRRLLPLVIIAAAAALLVLGAGSLFGGKVPSGSVSPGAAASDGRWETNVLMEQTADVFGTGVEKTEIRSITFLDTLDDAPDGCWDLSLEGDGSVLGWLRRGGLRKYDLYIAGDGGVCAPENAALLFEGYTYVTGIDFGGAFHTEGVATMEGMFCYCGDLTALDLSGFDTSSVVSMDEMFLSCNSLVDLDVTSFDTSSVTGMSGMFQNCYSLDKLDISNFDTSQVTDMSYMFYNCRWNTLNLGVFSIASVKNYEDFMDGDGDDWEYLFD